MGSVHSLPEFIDFLKRYILLILAVTVIGTGASVYMAMQRTQTWETTAVLQVETPVVAGDRSAASSQTARLLQGIQQRLTTRDSLTKLSDRLGLFDGAEGLSADDRVRILRQSIDFQTVPGAAGQSFGAPSSVAAMLITVRFGTGEDAASIANDVANSILEMSNTSQTDRAKESVAFYQAEETRVAVQIAELEAEIAEYKNSNNVSIGTEMARERSALEAEMRALVSNQLALQTERTAVSGKERLRVTDLRQLDDIDSRLEVLASQRAALELQLAAVNARIAQTPELERSLSAFNRELRQLQSQLSVMTTRKSEAETDLRLEMEDRAERFTLLEEALPPQYSLASGRKKVALMGMVASLFGAFAVAFALDFLRPVLRNASQMERNLGITPVVVVPDLNLPGRISTPLLPHPDSIGPAE